MHTDKAMERTRRSIMVQVQRFKKTRNVLSLLKALLLIIQQRRTLELLYGGYCRLVHPPSPLLSDTGHADLISLLRDKTAVTPHGIVSRLGLLQVFGGAFKVDLLPHDFKCARWESICPEGDRLIIGEYGENSRVACVTPRSCVLSDHYRQTPGVRHVHSIEKYGDGQEFLVSTGDSSKFLDLWIISHEKVSFVRRLKKRLAGFTAAVKVNGEYYFGTDFSSRANCIATLHGKRYFFPQKAYKRHVTDFYAFFDRYIVSINGELAVVGRSRTLSVFDTVDRKFIYCEFWDAHQNLLQEPAA